MGMQCDKFRNGPMPGHFKAPADLVPYNMVETDDDSLEVEMYGEVVTNKPVDWWTGEPIEGLYIVLSDFLNDLETYKEKSNVTFRINSPGGDVFAGITIRNRMTELKGTVTTIVDGLSASAASIIAQGATPGHRKVCDGSLTMIHGAASLLYGYYNANEMKDALKQVNAIDKSIAEIYAKCTGLDQDKIKNMMSNTTWMSSQEAIDNGFADEVVETGSKVTMSLNASKSLLTVNGIPMSVRGLFNLPDSIPVSKQQVTAGLEPDVINQKNNKKTGGKEKMTLDELMKSEPELVKQIQNSATEAAQTANQTAMENAVKAEVERIKSIDEIANKIADKDLVEKAKYGDEKMTAEALALQVLKNQASAGAQFIADAGADAASSGAADVTPIPNGALTAEEQAKADIAAGAALIAGIKPETTEKKTK